MRERSLFLTSSTPFDAKAQVRPDLVADLPVRSAVCRVLIRVGMRAGSFDAAQLPMGRRVRRRVNCTDALVVGTSGSARRESRTDRTAAFAAGFIVARFVRMSASSSYQSGSSREMSVWIAGVAHRSRGPTGRVRRSRVWKRRCSGQSAAEPASRRCLWVVPEHGDACVPPHQAARLPVPRRAFRGAGRDPHLSGRFVR